MTFAQEADAVAAAREVGARRARRSGARGAGMAGIDVPDGALGLGRGSFLAKIPWTMAPDQRQIGLQTSRVQASWARLSSSYIKNQAREAQGRAVENGLRSACNDLELIPS